MARRDEILAIDQSLREKYGSLYDELLALLFQLDPIGLDYETNTDEYAPEVRAILPVLDRCSSVLDVERETHAVFVHMFDAQIAGPPSRYEQLASNLWDLWLKHTRHQA